VGAAALAVALLFWPVQSLAVRPARGAGLLWAVPAPVGAEFRLTWTHTVSRRPIVETYTVGTDRRLCLRAMDFDAFGPNLPAGPEGGTTWQIDGTKAHVTGYNLCLDRLNLGVAPMGHHLQAAGRDWDMMAGAGSDRLVRLEWVREPWILIILTEVWQWQNTTRLS
jgi:hypothetical protein